MEYCFPLSHYFRERVIVEGRADGSPETLISILCILRILSMVEYLERQHQLHTT